MPRSLLGCHLPSKRGQALPQGDQLSPELRLRREQTPSQLLEKSPASPFTRQALSMPGTACKSPAPAEHKAMHSTAAKHWALLLPGTPVRFPRKETVSTLCAI